MQNIYITFEFKKIKEKIKEYSKTELAKEYIDNMSLLPLNELKKEKSLLKEMDSIISRFSLFPIKSSVSLLKLIDIAKKTGLMTARDLYLVREDIVLINDIITYYKKIGLDYPLLGELIKNFFILDSLDKEIKKCITSSLTVDDKASDNLYQIRHKIKKLESKLQEKVINMATNYRTYLSDDNVTIRDGHFVLPVKTAYKNKVVGIIYDVSDSKNTTFIEPLDIVQINNEITSLKVQENDEIRKILKTLTNLVLLEENEIISNNRIIAEIDFLQSKALYGKEINGTIIDLDEREQIIELNNARHPLIDKNKVVANSFLLNEEKRILIISGPNAGGKTISLKTVGLLVLMNETGLPLPIDSGRLSYFNNIYIDIGDNQSLSDNLSTFSAHIHQVSEIINVVKGKDLVLIDELGTGTDPKEGEALALSILEYLVSKHCFGMISSHFSSLKEYAFLSKNIENSSMIFNEEKLLPTYIFKEGVSGKSYAFEVAKRYGLKQEIIDSAKKKSQNDSTDVENLLEILQKKLDENVQLEIELKKEKEAFNKEKKRFDIDAKNLEEKRAKLLESVQAEKEKIIAEAEEEINDIMKSISKGDVKLHEVINVKNKIQDLKDDINIETFKDEINLNDYVSVPSLNIFGTVTRLKANKATLTTDGGMSINVEINKLKKLEKRIEDKKPIKYKEINIEKSVPLELNLLGLHVDEALEEVDKYLDSCRLKHLHQVRLIHGFGSGALKNAITSYLKKRKDLTFRSGNEYEGGGGATIVIFNE